MLKLLGSFKLIQHVIKINDTALYSFAFFEVKSIFFMTNHRNYACWMPLHSLDLSNLETSQPDLQKILTEGGFCVNRTGKSLLVALLIWLFNKQSMEMQRVSLRLLWYLQTYLQL